jgi:hypothetical protein
MKYVPAKVSRAAALSVLKTKKASPQILFVAGVAGVVGTTVLACRATLKVEDILNEAEKNKADAGRLLNMDEKDQPAPYSAEDYTNDIKYIGAKTTMKIVKLYLPSFALGVLSVAALTKSHTILVKRNAALAATVTAVQQAFDNYRKRVVDEYGEEKDREFRFGKVTETVLVEDVNGPKKQKVTHYDETDGLYSREYGPQNKNYTYVPESNIFFLKSAQNHCNDRLTAEGFLLLNDVYEYLGFPRTKEGSVVGWVKDTSKTNGDGYVDFRIFDERSGDQLHDFYVGRENSLLLDFNVDGVIYEYI